MIKNGRGGCGNRATDTYLTTYRYAISGNRLTLRQGLLAGDGRARGRLRQAHRVQVELPKPAADLEQTLRAQIRQVSTGVG
jgi:hypothetical protein